MRLGLLALAAVTLLTLPARAQAPQPDGAWYGWQIALVDLAAAGAIVGGVKVMSGKSLDDARRVSAPFLAVGALTYLIGGPVIHGLHHNPGAATRSLLLRIVLPVGLGTLGGLAGGQGVGAAVGAVTGWGIGGATAMAIDWIAAFEPNRTFALAPGPRTITLAMRF